MLPLSRRRICGSDSLSLVEGTINGGRISVRVGPPGRKCAAQLLQRFRRENVCCEFFATFGDTPADSRRDAALIQIWAASVFAAEAPSAR